MWRIAKSITGQPTFELKKQKGTVKDEAFDFWKNTVKRLSNFENLKVRWFSSRSTVIVITHKIRQIESPQSSLPGTVWNFANFCLTFFCENHGKISVRTTKPFHEFFFKWY